MHTTVSARHTALDDQSRERALLVLERLGRFTPRVQEGTAVFDHDAGESRVELRLHCAGGQVLVAHGAGPDHRSALDQAEAKAGRQLGRVGARGRSHRHPLNS